MRNLIFPVKINRHLKERHDPLLTGTAVVFRAGSNQHSVRTVHLIAAAQKPEQPKVTTKQVVAYVQSLQAQRTPASGDSDPPIKRKKGMTCINGEWHISE